MNNILSTLILLFAIAPIANASHWGQVSIPQVTLQHPEATITVKANPKSYQLEAIEVKFGDNSIVVPKAELTGLGPIDTASIKIVTSFGQGNLESRSKLTDGFYITIEFGDAAYHIDEDLERVIIVYPSVRFKFDSSKYTRRHVLKPVGRYKNKWKLFAKEPGEKEQPDGETERASEPRF